MTNWGSFIPAGGLRVKSSWLQPIYVRIAGVNHFAKTEGGDGI